MTRHLNIPRPGKRGPIKRKTLEQIYPRRRSILRYETTSTSWSVYHSFLPGRGGEGGGDHRGGGVRNRGTNERTRRWKGRCVVENVAQEQYSSAGCFCCPSLIQRAQLSDRLWCFNNYLFPKLLSIDEHFGARSEA